MPVKLKQSRHSRIVHTVLVTRVSLQVELRHQPTTAQLTLQAQIRFTDHQQTKQHFSVKASIPKNLSVSFFHNALQISIVSIIYCAFCNQTMILNTCITVKEAISSLV